MDFFNNQFDFRPYKTVKNIKDIETTLLILNIIFTHKYYTNTDYKENFVSDIDPIELPENSLVYLNISFSLALAYILNIYKHNTFKLIYDYKSQFDGTNYADYQSAKPEVIFERVTKLIENTIGLILPAEHYPLDAGAPYDFNYTSIVLGDQSKSIFGYSENLSRIYMESFDLKLSELNLNSNDLFKKVSDTLSSDFLSYEKLGYMAALSDYLCRNFDKAFDKLYGHRVRVRNVDKIFDDYQSNRLTYASLNLPFSELETTIHKVIEYVLQFDVLSEMFIQFQYQNIYKAKYSASTAIDVANSYARLELLKKPKINQTALAHLLIAKTEPEEDTKRKLDKGYFLHDSISSAISKFFDD